MRIDDLRDRRTVECADCETTISPRENQGSAYSSSQSPPFSSKLSHCVRGGAVMTGSYVGPAGAGHAGDGGSLVESNRADQNHGESERLELVTS